MDLAHEEQDPIKEACLYQITLYCVKWKEAYIGNYTH